VEVPIISAQNCSNNINQYDIREGMICAGCKEGGKDSCQVSNTKYGPVVLTLSPFYHAIRQVLGAEKISKFLPRREGVITVKFVSYVVPVFV
jgi:hypothetical protein